MISIEVILALLIAFAISVLLSPFVIPFLRKLKVPKIHQKTRVLCASFLRCLDRFGLLNINARHQPVELPPCKIPYFRFISGPSVGSLGGQSFVDHNDPVRLF